MRPPIRCSLALAAGFAALLATLAPARADGWRGGDRGGWGGEHGGWGGEHGGWGGEGERPWGGWGEGGWGGGGWGEGGWGGPGYAGPPQGYYGGPGYYGGGGEGEDDD